MIDFRYHLVSLISVFLALAIGVVLGAGPLQNSLGTALTDQVSSLRADRNATHAQLEQTEAAVNERDEYIIQAAQTYLPGTLSGHRVAVAVMPGTSKDDVESVTTQLTTAGATVVGQVTLTAAWVDPGRETFRATYAGQFAGYMSAPESADGNTVLGMGLATALTTSGDNARSLTDLLTASDTPLVEISSALESPADSVVVIGPRQPVASATPTPDSQDTPEAWTQALEGLVAVTPTVVVGDGSSDHGLVARLRADKVKISTVDSVGQASAAVSVPLALAHAVGGERGAYGFDDGATAVMPPTGTGGSARAADTQAAEPAGDGQSSESEGQ